jgi:hypothetical protein
MIPPDCGVPLGMQSSQRFKIMLILKSQLHRRRRYLGWNLCAFYIVSSVSGLSLLDDRADGNESAFDLLPPSLCEYPQPRNLYQHLCHGPRYQESLTKLLVRSLLAIPDGKTIGGIRGVIVSCVSTSSLPTQARLDPKHQLLQQ